MLIALLMTPNRRLPMEYKIVSGLGELKLEELVSRYIKDSWEPLGAPFLKESQWICQAMIRKARKKSQAANGKDYSPDCIAVLEHLNAVSGRKYEPVDANLKYLDARLKEYPKERLMAMVTHMGRAWPPGDKMHKYLRPATLFNSEKCAQYIGEVGDGGVPERSKMTWPDIVELGKRVNVHEDQFDSPPEFKSTVMRRASEEGLI
jgi:uncharacterized phage protein (TIGR02220 family)